MNGRFPSSILERYPHMATEDVFLWESYLEMAAGEWDSFDYDVRIGSGRVPPPDIPSHFQKMVVSNSKFRIDAVGYRGNGAMVFEVKPDTSVAAYGQFKVYSELFLVDFPQYEYLGFTMVTSRVHPDIERMMLRDGVIFEFVEATPVELVEDEGDIDWRLDLFEG